MLVTVVARERRRMGFAFVGAAVALGLAVAGFRLPFDGNIIADFGLGPRTVPGHGAVAPEWLWIVLSTVGGFGAGTLVELVVVPSWRWLRAVRRQRQAPPRESALLFVMLVGFLPTSIAYGPSFDRYLLLQLPLTLAWLAVDVVPRPQPDGRQLPRLPLALAAVMLFFSVAATHDYFAWQRARWSLVASLEADGIERADIEGGMEVDNEQNRRGDAFVAARPEAQWVVSFDAAGAPDARSADCDPWLPYAPRVVYARRRRTVAESAE